LSSTGLRQPGVLTNEAKDVPDVAGLQGGEHVGRSFTYGMPPHDWSIRVMVRAILDEAGMVSWAPVFS
jgi:hypothetical protein